MFTPRKEGMIEVPQEYIYKWTRAIAYNNYNGRRHDNIPVY